MRERIRYKDVWHVLWNFINCRRKGKRGRSEEWFPSSPFLNADADFFLLVLRFNLLQVVALSMTFLRQTVILK